MPNLCENEVIITGDLTELQQLWEAIADDSDKYSKRLVKLLPMPTALEGTVSPTPSSPEPHPEWAELLAKGEITQEWHDELVSSRREAYEAGQKAFADTGYYNWYDWTNSVWGTKWGDYDYFNYEFNNNEGGCIELGFYTAWGPFSDTFWHAVSLKFPNLAFLVSYSEEGLCFCGAGKYKNGETIAEEYSDDSDEIYGELSELGEGEEDSIDRWDQLTIKLNDFRQSLMDEVNI